LAKLDRERRKRQRKRALVYILIFILFVTGFTWFLKQRSTTTIFIARHAEVQAGVDNPGLSLAGRIRVNELLRVLGDVDVTDSFDAVFATRWRRTQETADPIALSIDQPLQIVDLNNLSKISEMLQTEYKGQVVLLVVDASDIQPLVKELEGSKVLRPIAEDEYDSIYLLSVPWFGKVKTLQFHYGRPYIGSQLPVVD
jgi:2,3-bisphosphoglycerate-dependent phosphoglycerate mutase